MGRVFSSKFPSSSRWPAPGQEFIGLSDITGFLRCYMRTILVCLAAALVIAWFYNSTTDPVYTATTQLLIEPKLPQHLQQGGKEVNLSLDTAQLESQIAVIQSEKIASMVIEELGLVDDPGFSKPQTPAHSERFARIQANIIDALGLEGSDWLAAIKQRFSATDEEPVLMSDFQRQRLTSTTFHKRLDVRRVGVSYAINISFTALDPEDAAKIANATANAFVREQIETKAEAAKQGGYWLETRLVELRGQMNEAMAEAQAFRSRHDYRVENASNGKERGENQPTLEELEVTAETYRKMYESFLQAYTNSVSQQSYPVADARVITTAMPPLVASAPRPKLMLAFAAAAGIMFGIGFAFIRHTFDWTIRSPAHIRDIGLECIGELPPIGKWHSTSNIDEVVRYPHSRYSHHLRNARTEISLAETDYPIRCLGITALANDSPKTVIASNLAALYAMSGLKTLVIDADVERATMSNRLLGEADGQSGAVKEPLQHIPELNIIGVPGRSFDLLSAAVVDSSNLVAQPIIQAFLSDLSSYDMVIVDLPAFALVPDWLSVGSMLDGVVVVAEWGKTQTDALGDLARTMQADRVKLLGVLLANSPAVFRPKRKPLIG